MKLLELSPSPVRKVKYHGIELDLFRDERYIAIDADGDMWAYRAEPLLRPIEIERGQWGVQRGDPLPRRVGRVELGGLDWRTTIADCGVDANNAS